MSWRVVFRTDASTHIGSGHVMRCLTLADGLRSDGAKVLFVCREHHNDLCRQIEARGFDVARLPRGPQLMPPQPMHGHWLGAGPATDATETRAAITSRLARPDWLVVDHYALDATWETALRPDVGRIMVIDDLADRTHDCDLLLDQNLVAGLESRYAGKVPAGATLLLGPSYALLQPDYVEFSAKAPTRSGPVRRVLLYFGAVDLPNMSTLALSAFLALGRTDVKVDLIIGPANPHAKALVRLASDHANIVVHRDLPSLAPLMAAADLAIGAGGATSWERLCLRLPAIVVTLAHNQRAGARELHRRGLIRWLGDVADVDSVAMQIAIAECLESFAFTGDFEGTVDGRGEARVQAILTVTATSPLKVTRVLPEHEGLLLAWANDPETRANAFNPQCITSENHRNWLAARLADPERYRLFIVETASSVPVGQVRFEKGDDAWVISYSVALEFRGRGLGRRVLAEAIAVFRLLGLADILAARVKLNNTASRRVFEGLGFTCARLDDAFEFRHAI